MKKQVLTILAIVTFGINVSSQVNIPDANFKSYLVGNGAINTNGDSEIQFSEASAFTELINCSNLPISDLTGIEAFTALTKLWCYLTSISSLDLTQNTNLIELRTNNTFLSSLNVTSNTNLTQLWCSNNTSLTSLDVTQNTNLTDLSCSNTSITSLDVTQNTALIDLICDDNSISSLDVTQNTALDYLECNDLLLTNLDVTQNLDLTVLDCSGNSLTSLDVTQNTALTVFICSYNDLTNLDVTQNTDLTVFICKQNSLTNADLTQNTALDYLDYSSNSLTSLDVALNTVLTQFNCDFNNNLESLNVANGNNINFTLFNAHNNPSLTCIQVDDVAWSTTNWTSPTYIDATASFSTSCNGAVNIDELKNIDFSIYPNPVNSQLTIVSDEPAFKTILDVTGKVALSISKATNEVDVSGLTKGVYFLQLQTENRTYTKRFIKN